MIKQHKNCISTRKGNIYGGFKMNHDPLFNQLCRGLWSVCLCLSLTSPETPWPSCVSGSSHHHRCCQSWSLRVSAHVCTGREPFCHQSRPSSWQSSSWISHHFQ